MRVDGVDVLADPGTYCYTGDDEARRYFRSTIGHNTLELGGVDQSTSGGPFMWTRHAASELISLADDGDLAAWTAEHDGYASLATPARHRRTVQLIRHEARLEVVDEVVTEGSIPARLAWHLGPLVEVDLDGPTARCTWAGGAAVLHLPPSSSGRSTAASSIRRSAGTHPASACGCRRRTLVGSGTAKSGTRWTTVLAVHR